MAIIQLIRFSTVREEVSGVASIARSMCSGVNPISRRGRTTWLLGESGNQPIRARYLGHVTGNQPVTDQHFLIRSVTKIINTYPSQPYPICSELKKLSPTVCPPLRELPALGWLEYTRGGPKLPGPVGPWGFSWTVGEDGGQGSKLTLSVECACNQQSVRDRMCYTDGETTTLKPRPRDI